MCAQPIPIVKSNFDYRSTRSKPLIEFKAQWGNVPKANGVCPSEKRPKRRKKFKWDAVRFANKVYAVFDAPDRLQNNNWVVWMDADTSVHNLQ